jgi:hypothetical protein
LATNATPPSIRIGRHYSKSVKQYSGIIHAPLDEYG